MLRSGSSASTPTQLQRKLRRTFQQMRHSPHWRHLHYYSCFLILLLYTYFAVSSNNPIDATNTASSIPLAKHSFAQLSDTDPTDPSNDQLVYVQLIHRHGDRTPIHTYPPSHLWDDYPLPPGSLTSIGWAQHNAVGAALRQRYMFNETLLTPYKYEPHSLVVRSTEVERCIQSVTALLSKLYPPELNYSATDAAQAHRRTTLTPYPPVNVMPMPLDYLLQATDKCPAYHLTYPQTQSESDAMITAEYPELQAKLVNLTGIQMSDVGNSIALHVSWTADNLLCEQAHNLSYNAELTAMQQQLYNLSSYVNYHRFVGDAADARGSIGDTLLRDVVVSVLNKMRVDLDPDSAALGCPREGVTTEACWSDPFVQQRLRIYSAHDTTIVSLLASLHVLTPTSEFLLPPYATIMSLELRKANTSDGVRYRMGWRIGAPNETVAHSGDWELQDRLLPVPCPNDAVVERGAQIELKPWCDVANVVRYVMIMTDPSYSSTISSKVAQLPIITTPVSELVTTSLAYFNLNTAHNPAFAQVNLYAQNNLLPLYQYPPNDGCCVPPSNLATLCSPYAAFSAVGQGCRLMRRLCPAVACGAGRVVDGVTFECVEVSDSARASMVDGLLIGGSAVIAALLVLVFVMWTRSAAAAATNGSTATDGHSGIGSEGKVVGDVVRKGQRKVQEMVHKVAAGVKEHKKRRQRGGERGNAEEREKLDLELYQGQEAEDEDGGGDAVLFDDADDVEADGDETDEVELETR